jgi:hypothetical protein
MTWAACSGMPALALIQSRFLCTTICFKAEKKDKRNYNAI